jgi:hypothetical protein
MRHPIQHAHASLKANTWLLDEAECRSDLDGRNHLTQESDRAEAKQQLKRKQFMASSLLEPQDRAEKPCTQNPLLLIK